MLDIGIILGLSFFGNGAQFSEIGLPSGLRLLRICRKWYHIGPNIGFGGEGSRL